MTNLTFTELANNVTLLYGVFVIVVLLAYIAYKHSSHKHSRGRK